MASTTGCYHGGKALRTTRRLRYAPFGCLALGTFAFATLRQTSQTFYVQFLTELSLIPHLPWLGDIVR